MPEEATTLQQAHFGLLAWRANRRLRQALMLQRERASSLPEKSFTPSMEDFMPFIRSRSAPIQWPSANSSSDSSINMDRPKSAPLLKTRMPATIFRAGVRNIERPEVAPDVREIRRAGVKNIEEEHKDATPAPLSGNRTRSNRFLPHDVFYNYSEPLDDWASDIPAGSLQTLDEATSVPKDFRTERGEWETTNQRYDPTHLKDHEISMESDFGEKMIMAPDKRKVEIYFKKENFNSESLANILSKKNNPIESCFIEFFECELSAPDIEVIANFLKYQCHNLEEIVLEFPCCNREKKNPLTSIFDALFKINNLSSLTLDFRSFGFNCEDQFLLRIADLLNAHKNLKAVTVAMQGNSFSENAVKTFLTNLSELKNLEATVLNFSKSEKIDAEVFFKNFLNLREMTSLRILRFALQDNKGFDKNTISKLCASLSELTNIEEFGLYARNSDINDEAIQNVLDATARWDNLRQLHIDACHCSLDALKVRQRIAAFAEARNVNATIDLDLKDTLFNDNRLAKQHLEEHQGHEPKREGA